MGRLGQERVPGPAGIVGGAGTGGTSATIGRYLRYIGLPTRLRVAEPAGMAFACAWRERNHDARATNSTCIEGIGRPNAEPGFLIAVVDEVVAVPDAASIAGLRLLEPHLVPRHDRPLGTHPIPR